MPFVLNQQPSQISFTLWLTGLSASGKTTLATALYEKLKAAAYEVVLLDGEAVREQLNHAGFSTDDRNELGLIKAEYAKKYNDAGSHVIVTGIAHHLPTREKVRALLPNYIEIFLDCPVEVCSQRDYKGHYAKAINGEYDTFIGVTEPYQRSANTELVIKTNESSVAECTTQIYNYFVSKLEPKQPTDQEYVNDPDSAREIQWKSTD